MQILQEQISVHVGNAHPGCRRAVLFTARSHALRGNAVKGALRRELSPFLVYLQAVRRTGQKLSVRNISYLT
jgi:hypothetical protein